MSIRVLAADEDGPQKLYRNDGEKVFVTGTIRPKAGDLRHVAENVEVDFEGVTPDEIRAIAARWVFINKVQNMFRAAKSERDREMVLNTVYNVRALLDATRSTADPLTKATNAAMKLETQPEIDALKRRIEEWEAKKASK